MKIELEDWPQPPSWLERAIPATQRLRQSNSPGVLPALEGHSPDDVRKWLLRVCEALDITPSMLARMSELAASTLNRFLRNEDDSANLSATTIARIKKAASLERRIAKIGNWGDKSPPDLTCNIDRIPWMIEATVSGEIRNYEFLSNWSATNARMNVFIDFVCKTKLTAFRIGNNRSGAPDFFYGDYVLGLLLCVTKMRPSIGSKVIAFRLYQDSVECGLWSLQADPGDRYWLMHNSEDPADESVFLGRDLFDNDRVYVSHMVTGALKFDQTIW